VGILLVAVAAGCARVPYAPEPRPETVSGKALMARLRALPTVASLEPAADGSSVPLDVLVSTALARDPHLAGLAAGVDAARASEAGVVRWRDPGLSASVERHSLKDEIETGNTSIGPQISVTRRRPVAVQADRIVRRAATAAARARLADGYWQAYDAVLSAAEGYLAAHAAHALATREAELLDRGMSLARKRVAAGLTPAIERSLLALSANRARVERISRRATLADATRALEAALNLAPGAVPEDLSIAYPEDPGTPPALPELVGAGVTRRGDVLGALAAFDEADGRVRQAVAAQYPDLTFSPSYFFDQGDQVWALLGSFVLPLATNHEPAIAAAVKVRTARVAEFEAMQTRALQEIATARTALVNARAARTALDEVLAALDEDFEEITMQYREGIIDELAVIMARHELVRVRYDLIRSVREVRAARRRLTLAARHVDGDSALARLTATFGERAAAAGAAP